MLSDSFIHLYKYPRVSYKIHSEQLNQCFETFCYHLQRSNSWFGSFPTFQISDMSELHPHAALRFSISTKYFQEISSRKCVFFQHSNANIRNLPIIASMSYKYVWKGISKSKQIYSTNKHRAFTQKTAVHSPCEGSK